MQWEKIKTIKGFNGPAFRSGSYKVATRWSEPYLYWYVFGDNGRAKKSGIVSCGQKVELGTSHLQRMFGDIEQLLPI
jgi:hypothetical protein